MENKGQAGSRFLVLNVHLCKFLKTVQFIYNLSRFFWIGGSQPSPKLFRLLILVFCGSFHLTPKS